MADRLVVTGAAGFIGSNLVAELNRRGYDHLLLVDNSALMESGAILLG